MCSRTLEQGRVTVLKNELSADYHNAKGARITKVMCESREV